MLGRALQLGRRRLTKAAGQITQSRRIAGYYLLFATAVVAWLSAGIVLVTYSVLSSRSESAWLARLGQVNQQIGAAERSGGTAAIQAVLGNAAGDQAALYWGFSSPTGQFLAHSNSEEIGKPIERRSDPESQWGEIERFRIPAADGVAAYEFRCPVRKAGKVLGLLHCGVREPNRWAILGLVGEYAPSAVLGPLLLSLFGALVLHRTAAPISEIERQLARVGTSNSPDDVRLDELAATNAARQGWNRLVAERKKAVQLQGLESRLSAALDGFRRRQSDEILNTLGDGVVLTDQDGRVTFANPATASLLGFTSGTANLVGRRMDECLGLQETDGPSRASASNDEQHPLVKGDLRARPVVAELTRGVDGAGTVLRVARQPVRTDSVAAATHGHVWSIRDITQQKLAEQMRNQFVNSATHELRTPLANIKAYAETLALTEMLDIERQKEFCNIINAEATRLARFVDDLLNISSIEAGSLALTCRETDVERMLNEVLDKVRPQMTQKNIRLNHSFPAKLPKLKVDKDKLAATLVNLLGNAAKYTPEGGTVTFRASTNDDTLHLDVEDTGFGISAEELPRIFDKFFRSSDERVQGQTGTGLGLSLAQEVARLHGGNLTVQSELNKGSKFTITLPMKA